MTRVRGPIGRAMKRGRMAVKNPLIEALSGFVVSGLDTELRTPADLDATPPRNILVIRTDRIGDLLCGSPFIAALRRRWPDARVTLLGGPKNRAAMGVMPYVERAPLEFAKHPVSWARLRDWLPRQGFDFAVSLRSEVFSGGLLAAWSRAPVRAVTEAVRTLPAFNLVLAPHEDHQILRYWQAARALGVTWPEQRPIIEIPNDACRKADAWVTALAVRGGTPLVGVGVPNRADGKHRVKAWPPATLAAFVRGLTRLGFRPILFGVGSERVEAEAIAAAVPAVTVAPAMPLAQVAAVQRRLQVFVASYTGTLHLADGAGTCTVAIGSIANRDYWRPLGPRHRQLAAPFVPSVPVEAALEAVRELVDAGRYGVPEPLAPG